MQISLLGLGDAFPKGIFPPAKRQGVSSKVYSSAETDGDPVNLVNMVRTIWMGFVGILWHFKDL